MCANQITLSTNPATRQHTGVNARGGDASWDDDGLWWCRVSARGSSSGRSRGGSLDAQTQLGLCERDASACMRRHQASALAPVQLGLCLLEASRVRRASMKSTCEARRCSARRGTGAYARSEFSST